MALEDVYRRNAHHKTHRAGWLRAAVLGANDGLVSTASLMIGVSAARADSFLITAGAAGIAAGAMSMAVGEYISVRSQNDIEESDRLLEIEHLAVDPAGELEELIENKYHDNIIRIILDCCRTKPCIIFEILIDGEYKRFRYF